MRVVVVTVTKRTGWAKAAGDAILAQTYMPYKWIIATEGDAAILDREIKPKRFGESCQILTTNVPEPIRLSNLNRSLNYALRNYCQKCDYVIFYQDLIDLPPDCFEKLIATASPDTFVTTATINDDGTDDDRYTGSNTIRPIRPEQWEANVSIAPMKIIKKLGGFDEEYDNGWSWDNVNLAERAAMLGCKFLIDETNRPRLLYHAKETTMPTNGARHDLTMAAIRAKKKPLKLHYLATNERSYWSRTAKG